MIQRIQSLYLLIALILISSLFFIPIYSVQNEAGVTLHSLILTKNSISQVICNYTILVLTTVSVFFLFLSLFSFKNRDKQMKLCITNIIAAVMLFIVYVVCYVLLKVQGSFQNISFSVVALIPVLVIVLCFLAYRAIKKDDDLVKSVDRLR